LLRHTRYRVEEDINKEWPKSSFAEIETYTGNEPYLYDKEPDKFYFTVEVSGALRPEEVILNAMRVLQSKLAHLQMQLEQESREVAVTWA
jgi:DNA-directed RNA polymerase II subunit RPB3